VCGDARALSNISFMNPIKTTPITYGAEDDVTIMERVINRDPTAFLAIHDRLAGPVYQAAYRVLNNASEAEEVTQDVLTQIWDKAPTYNPKKGRPITWATTMARNRAIDRIRANRRRCRLRDEFKNELEVNRPTAAPDAGLFARSSDDARVIRAAVAELNTDQREAIELVYFSGLTQKEAADRLHKPLGTIKARIRRGIHRLRETTPDKLA
ncbi:MAG: sigma-70 family RNA polymerase sigma factor, partial [Verrucomicrobiota bacterium]